jgi:hypothetical protein
MNKIAKLLIALSLFFTSCKSNKEAIVLRTYETKKEIILKYNREHNLIYGIKIPIGVNIQNNSIKKRVIDLIDYEYRDYRKGIMSKLYLKDGFIRQKRHAKIKLDPYKEKEYIVYTFHRLDSISSIQEQFSSYTKKLLNSNQDTLTIGVVSEFRSKHLELFNKITSNDSISVSIITGYSKVKKMNVGVFGKSETIEKEYRDIHTERIRIPVGWQITE